MVNKNYILPINCCFSEITGDVYSKTAIFIHLHYLETLDKYLGYIAHVSSTIQIYISTSEDVIIEELKQHIMKTKKKHIVIIKKNNRGRDVSALLVTFRKYVQKYDYICFVHDKKERDKTVSGDVNLWVRNLWENTLCTQSYVDNILNTFIENPRLGLLVPPEPIGKAFGITERNNWYGNYKNTQRLLEMLNINYLIDENVSPIALGTVFWCRVDSLKILFSKNWKYEDFPEEPLKEDGTISHAIERSFPYIAESNGYETGIVMTQTYADYYIHFLKNYVFSTFSILKKQFGINSYVALSEFESRKIRIEKFLKENKEVYLYGAGNIGRQCCLALRLQGLQPKGFIVSTDVEYRTFMGLPVLQLYTIKDKERIGIIITVSPVLQEEIIQNIIKVGITNYICYYE